MPWVRKIWKFFGAAWPLSYNLENIPLKKIKEENPKFFSDEWQIFFVFNMIYFDMTLRPTVF